ncbi:hypothetical protein ACE6H2_028764 [Prunus campanulata]
MGSSSGAVIIAVGRNVASLSVCTTKCQLMIMIMHAYGLYRSQIFYLQTK